MDVVIDVAWIFIYITLCPFVLCTHVFALYLLKKDGSFRNIQKYLIGTLCITEILLVIILLIRGVDILYPWSGFEMAILFGETTVWLMYFFLMMFITWDRFAEIKLNLKYPLYCNSKKAKTLLVITFFISLSLFVVLLSIQCITNGAWDYEYYLGIYVFPVFHGIIIFSSVFTYSYIFTKLYKNQIAHLKVRRQLQLQMDSLKSRSAIKLNSKPKLVVPSLIILTFLIFSTLPHSLFLIFSSFDKSQVRVLNFVPMFYFLGWFVDPVIYILSVKSIQQLFQRLLGVLK